MESDHPVQTLNLVLSQLASLDIYGHYECQRRVMWVAGHTAWRLLENVRLVVLIIGCLLGLLQEPLIFLLLALAVTSVGYSRGLLRLATPAFWLLSIQQCGVFGIGSSLG